MAYLIINKKYRIMVNTEMVKEAVNNGIPAIKNLLEKLDKEDALKAIGILAILGIGKHVIDAVKDIVTKK